MKQRGVVLIACYLVIAALAVLGLTFLTRSISERSFASKYFNSTQALWLAEAGANQALFQLKNSFGDLTAIPPTALAGAGEYSATIVSSGTNRIVTAHGFVPSSTSTPHVERIIEATMAKYIPPGFYGHAIYSAGDVSINSNCTVNGDVLSGGDVSGPVNGDIIENDPTLHANGLPLLNFNQLIQKSIQQGWYNATTGVTTFPDSFWNVEPTSTGDPGIPNVVFVNGDYSITGKKAVNYGFIVVGGNAIYDAEIGGNASVVGCIYTRGDITFKGGGGPSVINLDGGVWAGGTVTMTGNEQINYDPPGHGAQYMAAIEALDINPDVQVTAWKER